MTGTKKCGILGNEYRCVQKWAYFNKSPWSEVINSTRGIGVGKGLTRGRMMVYRVTHCEVCGEEIDLDGRHQCIRSARLPPDEVAEEDGVGE